MSIVQRKHIVVVAGLALIVYSVYSADAFAQTAPAAPAPATGAPATGAPAAPTVTQTATQSSTQFYPGGVAPVPAGGTLGGGNTEFSSSKPLTGNQEDTFDFRKGGGSQGTIHGNDTSSFILNGSGNSGNGSYSGVVPNVHNVHRGDTLWGICGYYFHNPYQWPRVWSFNPQIQNPHWIYPGDQVKLRTGDGTIAASSNSLKGGNLIDRRRQVPPETIFLRNEGFIEDDSQNWGELNGSREDKMFLSDFDEVYLRITANHDVKVGQELTVYRPIKSVGSGGKLIEIQGTVRVDQWNPTERIARARVTETLNTIERGARIGPINRRFEVIPPVRNDKDVEATILTSVRPHAFFGQNQVVFIDKGEEEGLKPGNRLFIIRKEDGFHATQPTGSAAKRISIESESAGAMEDITKPRDDGALPEEVIAELRVISTKKHTAMTMVTVSRREVEIGERAFARKGY